MLFRTVILLQILSCLAIYRSKAACGDGRKSCLKVCQKFKELSNLIERGNSENKKVRKRLFNNYHLQLTGHEVIDK